MQYIVKERHWSWRWSAAVLKSRGVWVVGREGEAKDFLVALSMCHAYTIGQRDCGSF